MPPPDSNQYAPGVPKSQYGFQGNQDIYGVGIRAGYYTQAFAVWGANFFVPHEAPFLHSVNILFMIAMLVGLIFLVDDPATTWAVEPFMLLNITYSMAYIGTGNPISSEELPWELNLIRNLVRQLSFMGLDGFAAWYWFVGLPKMKPTVGDLGTMVYWWNQGPLFGWVRTANEVVTVLWMVCRVVNLGCTVYVVLQNKKLHHAVSITFLKDRADEWMPYECAIDNDSRVSLHEPVSGSQSSQTGYENKETEENIDDCITPATEAPETPCKNARDWEKNTISEESTLQPQTSISPSKPTISPTSTLPFNGIPPTSEQTKSRHRRFVPKRKHHHPTYFPSLAELNHAEEYFKDIMAVLKDWPWYVDTCLWFYYWILCIPFAIVAALTGRFHLRHIVPIFQYLLNDTTRRAYHYPRALLEIWRHPYTRDHSVDWRALTLVTRFHLAIHPPSRLSKIRMALLMWHYLSFGIMLAVSTELTIQWNYIKGIQNIGNVGQLIPMSLGIGGLLKVVWGGIMGDDEWCGRKCATQRRMNKWKDVGEALVRAQQAEEAQRQGKRSMTGSSDMKKETV